MSGERRPLHLLGLERLLSPGALELVGCQQTHHLRLPDKKVYSRLYFSWASAYLERRGNLG